MQSHNTCFLLLISYLFTFVLHVSSSPVLSERATSSCTARDVAILRRTVKDETYFCKWWLSDGRTQSPFLEFSHSQVTQLCKCIITASTSSAKSKRNEQPSVENSIEKRKTPASCSAEISIQFTEPRHFCAFFKSYPRTTSPFARYPAKQLISLCDCLDVEPTPSIPFCSSQSSVFVNKPTQKSQASQYCSSLLKPTVRAVKTITAVTTTSKTMTKGVSILTATSSIRTSTTHVKVVSEQVIKSITARSTTTYTSDITESIQSGSLGQPQIFRRTAFSPVSVPSVWKSFPSARRSQACDCLLGTASLLPTTVYTSTKTLIHTATRITTTRALSTRIVSVISVSTMERLSTLRSTITSTVSTTVQTLTVKNTVIPALESSPNSATTTARSTTTETSSTAVTGSPSTTCSGSLETLTQSTTTTVTLTAPAIFTTTVTTGTDIITFSGLAVANSTFTITKNSTMVFVTTQPISTKLDISTVTADFSTVTQTSIVTATVCATSVAAKRRNAEPIETARISTDFPTLVVRPVANASPSCSNAGTSTTTVTITTEITIYSTAIETVNRAASLNVTQTFTSTPLRTFTPTSTVIVYPNMTITSLTTVTPITTTVLVSTTTVTVGAVVGTPSVALASPTAVTSVDTNGLATTDYDDQYFQINLLFAMELFGYSSDVVYMSVNGWVSLTNDASYFYTPYQLPSTSAPATCLLPYWNDLYIYSGTPQGLYYEVMGEAPDRRVSFEWYTDVYQNPGHYNHFLATYQEAVPGSVVYNYIQVDNALPASTRTLEVVGAQGRTNGGFAQYSLYNNPSITPGLELTLDTATNMFYQSNTISCLVTD